MKKRITLFGLILILAGLTGCGKNPMGTDPQPTVTAPKTEVAYQITYKAESTALDNVVTYVDGQGQSHQVHVGQYWELNFTAHKLNNDSFYVYLANASCSTENATQITTVKFYVDGVLVKESTCQRNYTLAFVEYQW